VLFVVFCAYGIGLADVWGVHSFVSLVTHKISTSQLFTSCARL
jgi:hypothetical protein